MGVRLESLGERRIPAVLKACENWEALAPFGSPYWRPRSEAELRRKVASMSGPAPASEYNFVMLDGDRLVGECSLHGIDYRNGVAQVGICIWDAEDRRRGYGRQGVQGMVDWGVGTLGIRRLEAWINEGNELSLQLFMRLGFQEEGVLCRRYRAGGRLYDVHVLARLFESVE